MRLMARRPVQLGDRLLGGPRPLICLPLLADTAAAAVEQAARLGAMRGADCLEVRLDACADLEPDALPGLLHAVARAAGLPLLVTNRHADEGGLCRQDEPARVATLAAALDSGAAALVDLEAAAAGAYLAPLLERARAAGAGVLLSSHDFSGMPAALHLEGLLRQAQDLGAHAVKLAVTPGRPEEVLALLELGLRARRQFLEIPAALIGMGPLGTLTRLGGGLFGSDLTFAVGERSSAPGQLPLATVRLALDALLGPA